MLDDRPALMAYLQLIQGNLPNAVIDITGADFTIGRDPSNALVLPDATISRHHARLKYAQGGWFLQDRGTKGGTYVNGEQVMAARLNPGDLIAIGDYVFSFSLSTSGEVRFTPDTPASSDEDAVTMRETGVSTHQRRKASGIMLIILAIIIICVVIGVIAAILVYNYFGSQIISFFPFFAP